MASLSLQCADAAPKKYLVGAALTIGRREDNTIVMDHPAVSSHHACVFQDGNDFVLEDLQSTNGTFVNGNRVSRCTLKDRDSVTIGEQTLVFERFADDGLDRSPAPLLRAAEGETLYVDAQSHQRTLTILLNAEARAADTASPPPATVGVLHVTAGRSDQPEYVLTSHTSLIGKSKSALVRVGGWWFTPAVAVAVTRNQRGYVATRLGGKLLINDRPINGRYDLKEGDILRVGGLTLEFRLKPSAPQTAEVPAGSVDQPQSVAPPAAASA